MFNVAYGIVDLTSWVVPCVGVGIDYQRARLSGFAVTGAGTAALLSPVLGSDDTRAWFAAQGIIGAYFPVPGWPAWP